MPATLTEVSLIAINVATTRITLSLAVCSALVTPCMFGFHLDSRPPSFCTSLVSLKSQTFAKVSAGRIARKTESGMLSRLNAED